MLKLRLLGVCHALLLPQPHLVTQPNYTVYGPQSDKIATRVLLLRVYRKSSSLQSLRTLKNCDNTTRLVFLHLSFTHRLQESATLLVGCIVIIRLGVRSIKKTTAIRYEADVVTAWR